MKVPRVLAVLGTVFALAAGVAAVNAPAAESASPGVPVLATGHVSFAAGVSSAQVLAFAQPDQEALGKLPNNKFMETPLMASADVGSDGNFTLSSDPASIPAVDEAADGMVNVEAVVVSGGQQLTYAFSATPSGGKWVSLTSGDPATAALDFNMAGGTAVNAKYSPTKWLNENGRLATSKTTRFAPSTLMPASTRLQKIASTSATTDATAAGVPICGIYGTSTYYKARPEHFVNVYDDGSANAHVGEGQSSTHTLGIAVELSGGGFGASGTASISRNASTNVTSADRAHSHGYWNKVNYRLYTNTCAQRLEKKPVSFYDFISADIDSDVLYDSQNNSCGDKSNGDVWDTTDATAVTFGGGVDLGGINVSAHSGYGKSVNIHYKFTQRGSMGGSSSFGPLQSAKVSASRFTC